MPGRGCHAGPHAVCAPHLIFLPRQRFAKVGTQAKTMSGDTTVHGTAECVHLVKRVVVPEPSSARAKSERVLFGFGIGVGKVERWVRALDECSGTLPVKETTSSGNDFLGVGEGARMISSGSRMISSGSRLRSRKFQGTFVFGKVVVL